MNPELSSQFELNLKTSPEDLSDGIDGACPVIGEMLGLDKGSVMVVIGVAVGAFGGAGAVGGDSGGLPGVESCTLSPPRTSRALLRMR